MLALIPVIALPFPALGAQADSRILTMNRLLSDADAIAVLTIDKMRSCHAESSFGLPGMDAYYLRVTATVKEVLKGRLSKNVDIYTEYKVCTRDGFYLYKPGHAIETDPCLAFLKHDDKFWTAMCGNLGLDWIDHNNDVYW